MKEKWRLLAVCVWVRVCVCVCVCVSHCVCVCVCACVCVSELRYKLFSACVTCVRVCDVSHHIQKDCVQSNLDGWTFLGGTRSCKNPKSLAPPPDAFAALSLSAPTTYHLPGRCNQHVVSGTFVCVKPHREGHHSKYLDFPTYCYYFWCIGC